MRHLFIKKSEDGIDFAMTSNDFMNRNITTLEKYDFEETELQAISNGNFFIFYPELYRTEIAYLKMLFEDEFKDKEDVDVNYLRNEFVLKIKDVLHKCYRLNTGGGRDRAVGMIIVVSKTKIFRIYVNFQVDIEDYLLDNNDVAILSIDLELGGLSPKDLLEEFIANTRNFNGDPNFPILYGNINKNEILIRDSLNNIRKCSKEDFVCRW